MNWDQLKGNWKQIKGDMIKEWGKLTNDDFDVINGDRVKLEGKLQEAYGIGKEDAQTRIDTFIKRY